MPKPVVAIVGRPNVGKSTLFNKIAGKRISIVQDTPGITRDRVYYECEWCSKEFMLVDTGGIDPYNNDEILAKMRMQASLAIDSAEVIIMVTDIRAGITANDKEIANMLIKSGKPIVLCVNKCDNIGNPPAELYEFYNLALGDPFPVSSLHGHGTGDLLDEVTSHLNFEQTFQEDGFIKIAVIGKPNVGKSSLVNTLLGHDAVIVSNIAGTTRDAIDLKLENNLGKFVLIDTAGIRRKSKVNEDVERYSVIRSYMAVDRADVCIMMIDAEEGFTEQDSKIVGYAFEQGKGCIIAVNKWDLIEKDNKTMQNYQKELEENFSFIKYAPFIFISVKNKQRLEKLLGLTCEVKKQCDTRIPTGKLNDMLAYATSRVQPPTDKGKRLKIYYVTQASAAPPTFVFFVNNKDLFHFSYQRYLENQIRETFTLDKAPIKFTIRQRGEE